MEEEKKKRKFQVKISHTYTAHERGKLDFKSMKKRANKI